MCGCYDVTDFVCFLTFFITALVALLSVQYLVVFLDSFSINAQGKPSYLLLSLYFWLMTLLGCMVFAGIQRRSITLLKWPGRLLAFLLISGLIAVTAFLWILDRTHHTSVHDLEGKTIKLFVMLCVIIAYFVAIHQQILRIQNPLTHGVSIHTLDDNSDQSHPSAIIADFIKKRRKGRKSNKFNKENNETSRPINVASDGINYYVVLLESPYKTGANCYTATTSIQPKFMNANRTQCDNYDGDDEGGMGSCSSITEV